MEIPEDAYRGPQGRKYGVVYVSFYGSRAVFVRWVSEGSKRARHGLWLVCGWGTLSERPKKLQVEPIMSAEDRDGIRVHFAQLFKGVITFLAPEPA